MQHKIEERHHKWIALRYFLSAPLIYAQIIPLVILDVFIEIYHSLAFPLYGLQKVKRSDYVLIDRQKLAYLDWFERLNCMYCGYANGLLRYCATIAGETEKYWCGIVHARYGKEAPLHQQDFLPYGDEEALEEFTEKGKDLHE